MECLDYANSGEKRLVTLSAMSQRPIIGTLELLPLCNMSCDMCYVRLNRAEIEAKGGLKPVSYWVELAQQMQQAGVLFLLLTGGEPLLYPGFKELYLELQKMGMILTVNTNGTLLDEAWADFFQENTPRRINITLYGSNEATYDQLCHYKSGYQKTLNAIRLLQERDVSVKINGSVVTLNLEEMEDIYRIGHELRVPVHMDTYMIPHVYASDNKSSIRLSPAQVAEAELLAKKWELSEDSFRDYCHQMLEKVQHNDQPHPTGIQCLAGNCSFAIDWQGHMRPCISMPRPVIHVSEIGFEKAWEQISQASKQLHIHLKCASCKLRPLCQTCVASAYLETGDYEGISDYLCEIARNLYQQISEITFD